ncbi:MAG: uracil-DNA glycosylase, partial [Desulfobacterales bacterium]
MRTERENLHNLFNRLEGTLRYLSDSGISGLHCRPETLEIVQSWERPLPSALRSLGGVRQELGDCARCRLSQTRRNIVFGEGDPRARLLFVGEGPGRDEDAQGR